MRGDRDSERRGEKTGLSARTGMRKLLALAKMKKAPHALGHMVRVGKAFTRRLRLQVRVM